MSSNPFFRLSVDYKLDYGAVLKAADFLERHPLALDYWLGITSSPDRMPQIARAVKDELDRRKKVAGE